MLFSSSLMPMLVEAGLTHQVVPCNHTVVVCGVRGRGGEGAAEHGVLMLFSSSLMFMLVDAGMTHQVGPCIHTVVVCVVRGERGEGGCIT